MSQAWRPMTPYFVPHSCAERECLSEFHSCSIWPLDFQATVCNRFYKFMQRSFRSFWLTVLIAEFTIHLSCIKLGAEVRHTWSFTNPKRISPVEIRCVILQVNLLYYISQSRNLETFPLQDSGQTCILSTNSILLEPSFLQELLRFWPDVNDQHLIISDNLTVSII